MQDIAGVRIVVPGIFEQDEAIERLRPIAPCQVKDRREDPKHGYRAVHMIFRLDGTAVEAQVRTALQQQWAEVSEKSADSFPELKYGGGPPGVRHLLDGTSHIIAALERFEREGRRYDELPSLRAELQELLSLMRNPENMEPLK